MVAVALNTPAQGSSRRLLLIAATLLALLVVGLGAYVRLTDAGLGCPDWPGCYGQLIGVPEQGDELALAKTRFPDQPVNPAKAWNEMVHRYAAGTLGLLVLGIALLAWRDQHRGATAENGLLLLIVAQAALGMWTVTLLLKPVIVTLHLIGGMATLATLVALTRREFPAAHALTTLGRVAVVAVFVQVALGGWVSSNAAALACGEFPTCREGSWWPQTDFTHGFALLRDLGATTTGAPLPFTALTAIHLSHRLGALVVAAIVGVYAIRCLRLAPRTGVLIAAALALQLGLGIANVLLQLPLPLAVGHNLGAALLLGTLVWHRPPVQEYRR